ncbi:DUF6543 domain-containing protein [uncultured Pseudomonas sp.]|uniref:dermonecrotic toxin domain-containing protein n=1 Tax=uncultured Pseudomonas sp. TaxID=114707 RepID=UPI0025CEDC92|nr:DUF6543 domain-containing protein [uncultured Pseudomonas sp.]
MIDSLGFELFPQGPDGQAAVDAQAPREDLLLELARCCLQVQRCLRTAPHLHTIAPALEGVEGLDAARSGRSAALAQWWAIHSVVKLDTASLASLLLRLVDLEALTFVHTRQSEREAVEALLLTRGEACELQRVWLVAGEQRIALPGTYAGLPDSAPDAAPTDLLVHCVATGVWFDAQPKRVARHLRAALLKGGVWFELLSETNRQQLRDAQECDLEFEPLERSLYKAVVEDLGQVQAMLSSRALQRHADTVQTVAQWDAAARLDAFVAQAQQYAAAQMAAYRHSLLPQWRRNLRGADLERYVQLEQQMLQAEQQCVAHLGTLASVDAYAQQAVSDYLQKHLALTLDPATVQLEIERRFATTDAGDGSGRTTLLNWALRGGYRGERLAVKVLDPLLASALDVASVQRMIDTLDLRVRYIEAVKQLYQHEQTQLDVQAAIAARLALASCAARFQGAAAPACDLIEAAAADQMAQRGIKAGLLRIDQATSALKHLLYLTDGSTHLLYAPGSPDGDFLVYPSFTALSLAVGGWAAQASGVEYLVEQSALADREALSRQLAEVVRKPTLWTPQTVNVHWIDSQTWSQVLKAVCARRCQAMPEDLLAATPQWYLEASVALRQALGDTDQELEQVLAVYRLATPLVSFQDYARHEVSQYINSLPGNRAGRIDPDKVTVHLDEDRSLSLTELVMKGHDTRYNFAQFARIDSTTPLGQDVSHLDRVVLASYVRSARLGERYIELLKGRYLDPAAPGYTRQRELHRLLVSLKMRRDLLCQRMQGQIPEQVAGWLLEGVESLATPQIADDFAVVDLRLDGCRIEGAYRLYRASKPEAGEALYLPDVAQGPAYRSRTHLAQRWREDRLGDYFYARASWRNQPRIGSLHQRFMRDGDGGHEVVMRAIQAYRDEPLRDLADDLAPLVRRLIADADRHSTSVAERVSSLVVEWVIVAAGLLTIPIPPANMLVGIGCAVRSFFSAGQAWKDGDRAAFYTRLGVGALGLFASSGALGRVLGRVSQSLRGLLGQQPQAPSIVVKKVPYGKWIVQLADDFGADAASEVLPALYDGFDDELLKLVELKTWNT